MPRESSPSPAESVQSVQSVQSARRELRCRRARTPFSCRSPSTNLSHLGVDPTMPCALIPALALALAACAPPEPAADTSTTAFVGVSVVPMDTERVLANQTVVV